MNVRKVKALGRLLLKLETRSRTGTNRKLLLMYITYLLPGLFVPWILISQNMDAGGFEFAFLSYLLYSITICFTIINELDNIIISKSEAEVFSALPIDNRLIVAGKMYMMLRYYLFLSLPLLLPGGIFYLSLVRSVPHTILYLISGFLMILFVSNLTTLLYTAALKILKPGKLGSVSLVFQIILIFILMVSYQLVSYGMTGKMGMSAGSIVSLLDSKGLLNLFPQAWYAFLPARNNYEHSFVLILKILLPIFICQMSYFSVKWYLEANYNHIREKYLYARILTGTGSREGGFFIKRLIRDFIQKKYLKNSLERSAYGLLSALYKNDKSVKLSILPMIIIPAALALFALFTNQLPTPFETDVLGTKPVFHISILLCVLVVLNISLLSIKITNYPGAAWIYDAYPMESRKSFKNGIRKFMVLRLLIPVFMLLFIVMIFKIPFHYSALHAAFMFAVVNLYNSAFNTISKTLPFTKENSFINSVQRLSSIIFPFIYGTIASILMLVVYNRIDLTIAVLVLLFVITYWVNYFSFVRKPKIPNKVIT